MFEALRRLLPGLWAGWLICVALLAAPSAFAILAPADAGRVVGRMVAQEAHISLALGLVLLILERLAARQAATSAGGTPFSTGMVLSLGAIFCTVAGYFALQPMMTQARAGAGALSFGQLHALSAVFYLVKTGLVLALAWRALHKAAPST